MKGRGVFFFSSSFRDQVWTRTLWYLVGVRSFSPEVKVAGTWRYPFNLQIFSRLRMSGTIPPPPTYLFMAWTKKIFIYCSLWRETRHQLRSSKTNAALPGNCKSYKLSFLRIFHSKVSFRIWQELQTLWHNKRYFRYWHRNVPKERPLCTSNCASWCFFVLAI
jgi:hypothetical protein